MAETPSSVHWSALMNSNERATGGLGKGRSWTVMQSQWKPQPLTLGWPFWGDLLEVRAWGLCTLAEATWRQQPAPREGMWFCLRQFSLAEGNSWRETQPRVSAANSPQHPGDGRPGPEGPPGHASQFHHSDTERHMLLSNTFNRIKLS